MCCLSQHLERLRLAVVEAVASSADCTNIAVAAAGTDIVEEDIASAVAVVGIVAASVLPFQPSSNQHC